MESDEKQIKMIRNKDIAHVAKEKVLEKAQMKQKG